MTVSLNIRHMTIQHGEKRTIASVDVVEEVGGGIKRVIGSYELEFGETFRDGADAEVLRAAIIEKLSAAGIIQTGAA